LTVFPLTLRFPLLRGETLDIKPLLGFDSLHRIGYCGTRKIPFPRQPDFFLGSSWKSTITGLRDTHSLLIGLSSPELQWTDRIAVCLRKTVLSPPLVLDIIISFNWLNEEYPTKKQGCSLKKTLYLSQTFVPFGLSPACAKEPCEDSPSLGRPFTIGAFLVEVRFSVSLKVTGSDEKRVYFPADHPRTEDLVL